MIFKFKKESGQTSRLLLVLAVVVLVAVVIVYLVMKMAEKPPAPATSTTEVVLPVYEQTLGDVRFVFESALDRGSVLSASEIANTSQFNASYQKDFPIDNPGAKFIQVTIGAQNMGTENTVQNAWDIENIVDSKGRNFVPVSDGQISPWIPNPNLCGTLLKPAFDPTPCVKIYEVSKASTGLKIRVLSGKDNKAISSGSGNMEFLIDLIVK